MFAVTGCRRSGTSLWMQILAAGGVPIVGERFSHDWEEALADANREGFWESDHRDGVASDVSPDLLAGKAVKVFVHGLVTTDVAHLEKAIATLRPWREHVASVTRFEAIEEAARGEAVPRALPAPLEWWYETYCLLGDVAERGYPLMLAAYDTVLEAPRETIERAFGFLEVEGDLDAAVAAVRPELRTQRGETEVETDLDPEIVAVFDELYDRVRERRGFDGDFLERMNATQEALEPLIAPHLA